MAYSFWEFIQNACGMISAARLQKVNRSTLAMRGILIPDIWYSDYTPSRSLLRYSCYSRIINFLFPKFLNIALLQQVCAARSLNHEVIEIK